MVELLPGIHHVCIYYIAPAHEKSIGCSEISFKAESGHMYIAEPINGNTIDALGRVQNTWHPIIKDITNEHSIRKQKIEKYIAKNKHRIKDF